MHTSNEMCNFGAMTPSFNEQETIRREKKAALEQLGIDPYPAVTFEANVTTQAILNNYAKAPTQYQNIALAGRLMNRRIMGSASFATLQDAVGKIQLYIARDTLCPHNDKTLYNTVFKKLIDIGDIIGVHGFVFTTKVGETSIHVTQLTLLAKSLKPLPIVKEKTAAQGQQKSYDAFTDPEQRYRQRYLDLIVNPLVKEKFRQRTKMINTIRQAFNESSYLEVETPILQPIYGGAAARPFKTHHHTLDMPSLRKSLANSYTPS